MGNVHDTLGYSTKESHQNGKRKFYRAIKKLKHPAILSSATSTYFYNDIYSVKFLECPPGAVQPLL